MKVGDRFKLSEDAIENYGEQYRDVVFVITSWANEYVPSRDYFANPARYTHRHPGYDKGVYPQRLYDFEDEAGELTIGFSVYNWEVVPL